MRNGLYVQFGCGWNAPNQWLNFDSSPTLRIEKLPAVGKYLSAVFKRNPEPFPDNVRYGDIVKGLPLSAHSCAGIYSSHVLEHLSLEDCRKALLNTKQLLSRNGLFRFVLPDLSFYIKQYESANGSDAALEFIQSSGLGERVRVRGIMGLARELLGNSKHRWMWDYPSMRKELKRAGFVHVRRAVLGDSDDPMFAYVEREERWKNCLGMECRI